MGSRGSLPCGAAADADAGSTVQILGGRFFRGTLAQAVQRTCAGGLVLAPSGPGMGDDLVRFPAYRNALLGADLVLPDSGAMVLFWNLRHLFSPSKRLKRLSGLAYLQALLQELPRRTELQTFWVMPNEREREVNLAWLREHGFPALSPTNTYLAPAYSHAEGIADESLARILEDQRPQVVFLNVGGGIQEPLGYWLKQRLSFRPAIICTGAAIAFLTGQQAAIPGWADRTYLGWLLRILSSPAKYFPRYRRATRLVPLLLRYGSGLPPLQSV